MEHVDGGLIFSATDLINHLECPHLTHLNIEVALGRAELEPSRSDTTNLVARKGDEHERAHLDRLAEEGREIVRIGSEPGLEGTAGRAAHGRGDAGGGRGDLPGRAVRRRPLAWIQRLPAPRRASVGAGVVQLRGGGYEARPSREAVFPAAACFYSELVEAIQGGAPERMHVVLGTRESQTFRVAEFVAYYRSVKRGFEDPIVATPALSSDLSGAGRALRAVSLGGALRRAARGRRSSEPRGRIRRSQRTRLGRGGSRPSRSSLRRSRRIAPADRDRGRSRACVRRRAADGRSARRESSATNCSTPEEERGFARLPEPSEGDVFFDMEGDPFFDDGLEYLFGGLVLVEDCGSARFPGVLGHRSIEREAGVRGVHRFRHRAAGAETRTCTSTTTPPTRRPRSSG